MKGIHRHSVIACLFNLSVLFLFLLPQNAHGLEKVILQLRWDHQFQFAGYYAALWQGYYKDAGLDVEIRSAITPERKILRAVEEVSSRRADFGIGAADILIARDRGAPLVLLASIFQQSASRFYALEKTGLRSPADLTRLRVARNLNDLIDVELQAMLNEEGIDPEKVKAYPHEPGIDHLAMGHVDVIPGYSTSIPYYARMRGLRLVVLRPANYGVDFYGDSLFTHERLIRTKPDVVQKFKEASLKGWLWALENSEVIADRISRELPRLDKVDNVTAFNRFQIEKVKLLTLYPTVDIGHINPERWKQMHNVLQDRKIVHGILNPKSFIYDPDRRRQEQHRNILYVVMVATVILLLATLVSMIWIQRLRAAVRQRNAALTKLQINEKELRETTSRLNGLIEASPMAIVSIDLDSRVRVWNPAAERLFGWKKEEVTGHPLPTVPERKTPEFESIQESIQRKQVVKLGESQRKRKNGTLVDVNFYIAPLLNADDYVVGSVGLFIDITDRKKAESALLESEEKYRILLEESPDPVFSFTEEGQYKYVNRAFAEGVGKPVHEIIGYTIWDVFPKEEADKRFAVLSEVFRTGEQKVFEVRVPRQDGDRFYVTTASPIKDETGRVISVICSSKEITRRKEAEDEVLREKLFSDAILDSLPDTFYVLDEKGHYVRWNMNQELVTGYSSDELSELHALDVIAEEDRELISSKIAKGMKGEYVFAEAKILLKNGKKIPYFLTGKKAEIGGNAYLLGMGIDISEKIMAKEALRQTERLMANILEFFPDPTFVIDSEGKVIAWNKAIERLTGVKADQMLGKGNYEYSIPFYGERRPILIDLALLSYPGMEKEYDVFDKDGDVLFGESYTPGLPGGTLYMSATASVLKDASGNIVAAIESIRDNTERKILENDRLESFERMRRGLAATVRAISTAVEVRDPYTAGHQQRVSDLARAIATEMGLTIDQTEGIRVAGVIHDIGKISIPSEILSKPSKLSLIEFQLIQVHPEAGFEILRDVEFPWPVAKAVLQHHERMDGSGYPRGLKGEEIIIEARVLAVADVVESMASHRPYRPTLGIEAALDEIEKNKGISYDKNAVDACLKLFREKGYQLP